MDGLPRVRVVVLNYDGGEMTLRCLDALARTEWPADRLEVVVVDNASVDGLVWTLRERYPWVRLVEPLANEGFARGCNLGMGDLAEVDCVALLNNDAVPEPGWLLPLWEALAADPLAGAACPKIVFWRRAAGIVVDRPGVVVHDVAPVDGVLRFDERWSPPTGLPRRSRRAGASVWVGLDDGAAPPASMSLRLSCADGPVVVQTPGKPVELAAGPQPAWFDVDLEPEPFDVINNVGSCLYEGWFGGDRGFLEPDLGQYDEPAEVFAWCGGAVLLRSSYLAEVGRFDPSFFLYYEDFELSWRGRERGWRYVYVPTSVVRHAHAWSSGEWSDFFTFWVDRNRRLTLVQHAPAPVAVAAVAGKVAGTARFTATETLAALRAGRRPPVRRLAHRAGDLGRLLSATPGALRARAAHRRRALVPVEAIASRWTASK